MNIYSLTIEAFKRVVTLFVIIFPLYNGISIAQPPTQDICLVTVDSTSTKNIIVWEKPVTTAIDSFKVYRDIAGTYVLIGSVPYNSLSIFIDSTNGVNPQLASYRYKLSVVDTAGIESALSAYHETINLVAAPGIPPSINLIWVNYEGFSFGTYIIYRDTTGTGNFDSLNALPSSLTSFTDPSPPTSSNVYYRIDAKHPTGCNPTISKISTYNSARSNISIITMSPALSANAGTDIYVCTGDSVMLGGFPTASGGTPPYLYNWLPSTGLNNPNLPNPTASPGINTTYYITVTDSIGSMATDTVIVYVNPVPAVDLGNDTTICNGCSITLDAGFGFIYNWSTGETTQTITVNSANTYYVMVTDGNGCSAVDSVTIIIVGGATLSTSITGTDVSCFGGNDGAVNLTVTGGTPPYSYLWSTGDTIEDLTAISAGTFTVTVTDSVGDSVGDTIIVSQPPALTTSITGTDATFCGGSDGSADLTVSNATPPLTFNWSTGDTTQNITGLSAGSYSVTVTDSNGCLANGNVTINQPSDLTATITGTDVTTCGGSDGTADLILSSGTPPFIYIWSNGDIVQDLTGLTAGTYTVTVSDSNGCAANSAVTISGPAAISLSFIATDIACNGMCEGKAKVIPSGGISYSFLWDFAAGGQTTDTVTDLCAGTYNVQVTDTSGCTATASVTISEASALSISISTSEASICNFADGIASASVTGGVAPYSYVWSSGDTTEIDSALLSGIHYLTVTDTNNCIAYGTAIVNDLGGPDITIASISDLSCNGDANGSIDISVSGGNPPYSYTWSNGNTSEDIMNLSVGIYEITITDTAGCNTSQSITITDPDPLNLSVTTTGASCNGSDGSATAIVSGGIGTYSYFWSTFGIDSFQNGLSANVYTVTVFDANGCFIASPVTINNFGGPTIILDSKTDISCDNPTGGSINISITGGISPYSYLWSNSATTQDLSSLDTGIYYVIVTDTNGCIAATSITISMELPASEAICIVTVDSATGKNLIVWEKTAGSNIQYYNIYKEGSAANVYSLLTSVPYDSVSIFLDILADPMQRSWRYKITAVDSCGNESELSQLHKTMHLTMNLGLGGVINLIWDHYEGFNFGTYYIYRGTLGSPLDSIYAIASNLHSWTDCCPPNTPKLFYQVAAVYTAECQPTFFSNALSDAIAQSDGIVITNAFKVLQYNSAKSNVTYRTMPVGISPGASGVQNLAGLNVYPNPYTGKTEITYFLYKKANVSLEVYNILGKKIKVLVNEVQNNGKYRYNFSANDLGYSSGVYILKLMVGDGIYTKQLVEF